MLDKKEEINKLDKAVDAFLALDLSQVHQFCRLLADAGVYVNFSISHFNATMTSVGVPMEKAEK